MTDIDATITRLEAGAARWARMSYADRAALLRATHAATAEAADAWVAAALAAKQTPAGPAEGEEWLSGPFPVMNAAAEYATSFEALARGRSPIEGVHTAAAPGGRTAVRMLPRTVVDRLLYSGITADLWLEPGVTADEARAGAGPRARPGDQPAGVGVVLGAGNISSIGPMDVLDELVIHGRATMFKLNPTFDGLTAVYQGALAPLIAADLVAVVNGGAEIGAALVEHPGTCHVHITGAETTHDAIVWGLGSDKSGTPRLTKPISSELGGVTPVIVAPGDWAPSDLRFQAEHVASMKVHNSGHNCVAAQMVILPVEWALREEFLTELRRALAAVPARPPWYPNTAPKLDAARSAYPDAEEHGGRLLAEVTADSSQDLLTCEYFGPVLGHTSLPGTGIDYLRNAVAYANDRLTGSLGATVIVRPVERKTWGAEFDQAIADLRYGTVGINIWSGIAFLDPRLSWGAYPGNTLDAVGSGIGRVHNAGLVPAVERVVAVGPFRPFPRSVVNGELSMLPVPPWFATARTAHHTARAITRYAAEPSLLRIPAIFAHALRA
ncbi:aldehyde dehydrogenase family protein [Nocardia sp. GTS18]|uniref:aldehyde dehydrogenase family protein n=1 Tax=Nocardia sp. GTS18 TaxID=1778064 RepID=UPI0015EF57FE|nr:aldehyde dehydrogenase family protein [Nocardia sp. GTS18]